MKWGVAGIVLLLIGVIVISGCVGQISSSDTNNVDNTLSDLKIESANSDYFDLAHETLESTYCEKMVGINSLEQDLKDRCFGNIGIITRNVEVCKKITNITELYECASGAKGDFSFCDENSYPGDCYRRMAIITDSLALCELAKEYTYSCYIYFAGERQDSILCQKIKLHTTYPGDEISPENTEFYNWCMAVANKNIDNCAKIPVGARADMCYEEVAGLTGNVSICNNILVEFEKNLCINDLALANNDTSQCELISSNFTRETCFRSFEYEREKEARR